MNIVSMSRQYPVKTWNVGNGGEKWARYVAKTEVAIERICQQGCDENHEIRCIGHIQDAAFQERINRDESHP